MNELFTKREIAEILNIRLNVVELILRKHNIKHLGETFNKHTKAYLYKLEDFQEIMIDSLQETTTTKQPQNNHTQTTTNNHENNHLTKSLFQIEIANKKEIIESISNSIKDYFQKG